MTVASPVANGLPRRLARALGWVALTALGIAAEVACQRWHLSDPDLDNAMRGGLSTLWFVFDGWMLTRATGGRIPGTRTLERLARVGARHS